MEPSGVLSASCQAPLSPPQVAAYLQRIGYPPVGPASTSPRDLSLLASLQKAHALAVPQENFSLHVPAWRAMDVGPMGLKLDVPSLFDKIVTRRRGGYCFEANTLFSALLVSLGWRCRAGGARVVEDGLRATKGSSAGHDGPHARYNMTPELHMLLFVTGGALPPGEWVCDVGFGQNTPHRPLELVCKEELAAGAQGLPPDSASLQPPAFRLRWGVCGVPPGAGGAVAEGGQQQGREGVEGRAAPPYALAGGSTDSSSTDTAEDLDGGYYVQVLASPPPASPPSALPRWHDVIFFTSATYASPMDTLVANHFTSLAQGSRWTQAIICGRVDGEGVRYTLHGDVLKTRDPRTGQGTTTQILPTPHHLARALLRVFDIALDPALDLGSTWRGAGSGGV